MNSVSSDNRARCPLDGVIVVDKPVGITSHNVVNRVRRAAGQRRVGHCGTLDPMACGVLVMCLGRATRLARFALDMSKTYVGVMRLGVVTDTQDRCGRVLERRAVTDAARERITETAREFTGPIMQVPPMYSAVKQSGVPMYRLARAGRSVTREPRPVTIHELEIGPVRRDRLEFRAVCSSGTYIRTLCHDIGARLGCGAVLGALRRTAVGHFGADAATSLDEFRSFDDVAAGILHCGDMVPDMPSTSVNAATAVAVINGRPVPADGIEQKCQEGEWIRIDRENGRLLAVGQLRNAKSDGDIRCVWPRVVLEERACAS